MLNMWDDDIPIRKTKKAVKTNGFSMFLFEYKREKNLDMAEAQIEAGEVWAVSWKEFT